MLALDFAFGLRGAGVTEGDAVKVERRAELGEGVGILREEETVAIDVEFEGQAVFGEGVGQEVEVGQEVFAVVDRGAGAEAGAIIQQIEQRIVPFVAWEPAVRGGVELPERPDLEALPAAQGSRGAAGGFGVRETVGDGPAADGGGIELAAEAAMNFRGSEAVGGGRFGGEEFAQEGFDARRPLGGVIPAGGPGRPGVWLRAGRGAEILGVEFVEASAAEAELFRSSGGGKCASPEGREDFADPGSAEAVRELAIMFFMVPSMAERSAANQRGLPALRAFRRPPLRSGLLQTRRAGSVRLCSHTCSGLNAHCSPLLATQQLIRWPLPAESGVPTAGRGYGLVLAGPPAAPDVQ